jgi:hypothetical protein
MTVYQKIKEALSNALKFAEETHKESELQISEVALGGKVELVNPDGTLSPAPDGEYTVGENTFTVRDGFIVELNGEKADEQPKDETPSENSKPEQEMAEEPKQGNPAQEQPNEIADLKAQLEAQAQAIEELKQAIASMQEAIGQNETKESEMSAQFSNQLTELNDTLKQLAAMPAEFSKTNTSNRTKDSNKQKESDLKAVFGIK